MGGFALAGADILKMMTKSKAEELPCSGQRAQILAYMNGVSIFERRWKGFVSLHRRKSYSWVAAIERNPRERVLFSSTPCGIVGWLEAGQGNRRKVSKSEKHR